LGAGGCDISQKLRCGAFARWIECEDVLLLKRWKNNVEEGFFFFVEDLGKVENGCVALAKERKLEMKKRR